MFIVHKDTFIIKRYNTERGAKIALKRRWLKKYSTAEVHSYEEFHTKIDHLVTVYNFMSKRPIEIWASEVGSSTDPSTERYWSM